MARRYILVVEDDEPTRRQLVEALGTGYEVVGVGNGVDALSLIDRLQDIAFAIFDNNLPELNGIDILQELARRQSCIPTMLMSGLMNQALEQQALSCGATFVVRKPLDLRALREVVDRHLAAQEAETQEVWHDHLTRAAMKSLPGR